ncbi:hypothetical protein MSAN_01579800 [Mycena sanguinolenta]|uniref:BTB domain-containing protein n=1 Tax=Mycena sanguinolenta TaxID=230812 RepID=A0A8H7CXE4_9AGAR|nr:hypothetical protein MSAN_01579800 [Mycena sanguinolenta]
MATSGTHALSLQEATRNSTAAWQRDLAALFQHAKDRFPDVVWELSNEPEDGNGNANGSGGTEEVWGHKAIVYARAPPSFQTRYFSFRPVDGLGASTMSLDIPRTSRSPSPLGRASPAPSTMGGITRLTTSINPALFSNELEYLYTGQGFGEAFEFLFDEHAGEDSTSLDGEELRIDKLRKDLVFMWRSRLYSDVRVALTMNGPAAPAGDDDDADAHERQMPVFSSHRFILASRSPYFHTALVTWPSPSPQKSLSSSLSSAPGEPLTLTLPSPPFTPASLHFTLGFLYTGTLVFSHRTYDLSTALALLLSANYLQLPTLHTEVQARIVSEMAHGLFHAALPFAAYEELTKGAWRAGGCTCRKCAMRVPRILEFSLRPDVQDAVLERGARRALVGLFGTGWCTSEFAALPAKLQASALKGLAKRTTPANALPILWAAEAALARLSPMVDPWVDVVRPLIESGRSQVDAVLGNQTAEVLGEADWTQIMHTAGVRFEDGERVEWTMRAVVRGLKETNAGRVYQVRFPPFVLRFLGRRRGGRFRRKGTLAFFWGGQCARGESSTPTPQRRGHVSFPFFLASHRCSLNSLKRSLPPPASPSPSPFRSLPSSTSSSSPHPDPPGGGAAQDEFPAQPLLSQTSHVRVQVEQARMDTLTWLKRGGRGRADRVAREGGLDGVEAWAVREIADLGGEEGAKSSALYWCFTTAPVCLRRTTCDVFVFCGMCAVSTHRLPSPRNTGSASASFGARLTLLYALLLFVGTGMCCDIRAFPSAMRNGMPSDCHPHTPTFPLPNFLPFTFSTNFSAYPDLELPFDDLVAAIPPAPGQHARQPTSTSAARKSTGLLRHRPTQPLDPHAAKQHARQRAQSKHPHPRGARSVTRNGGLAASASSSAANSADEAPDEEEEHEEENEATAEKDDIPLGDRPDSKLTPEPGIGLGLGLSDKGKGRANGNGHGNGSAPPSPTVAAMKKPPVPTRAVPVPPSPAPSSSSATSVTGSPVASRSTVSVNLTPPQPPQARPRSAASSRTGTTSTRTSTARPGSAASQRSTSTVRTTRGGLKAPPLAASNSGGSGSSGRRTSTASTTDFHTAPSTTGTRSRQSSVSSAVSRHSTATAGARSRRTSNASDVSVRTTGGASTSTNRPPVPALDPALHSPARRRGTPSIRSVASSTSTMDTAASAARKAAAAVTREKRNAAAAESKPETKVITLKQRGRGTKDAQKTPTAESSKDKEKEKALPTPSVSVSVSEAEEDEDEKGKDHRKTDSTASSASASTLRVKRKGSGDTVSTVTTKAGGVPSSNTSTSTAKATAKPKTTTAPKRPAPAAPVPVTGTLKDLPQPRGATLDIGIPCIIASKRKRFKAFARYIGEVEGESGPWVGVEVPPGAADNITFSSSSSSIGGGRQWHDGSWGGIRYFEIGPAGSGGSEAEYGYGDDSGRDRASRRRRLEGASGWSGSGGGTVKGVKREGDSSLLGGGARGAKRIRSASPAVSDADGAGEARGLFVRPSAVLYVVDAVGADI